MIFSDWEPIYVQILADFGFARQKDDEAARLISAIITTSHTNNQIISLEHLQQIIAGREVIICGNAPSLDFELHAMHKNGACRDTPALFIAADGATTTLLKHGIVPDIIVSDLDGNLEDIMAANRKGSIVVVHAHGDNMDTIRLTVPKLTGIIATTQSTPLLNVHNFGGFSDGDRCVFMACEFGAARITLMGFDLDDLDVTPMKKNKLKWARKLIGELADKCPALAGIQP